MKITANQQVKAPQQSNETVKAKDVKKEEALLQLNDVQDVEDIVEISDKNELDDKTDLPDTTSPSYVRQGGLKDFFKNSFKWLKKHVFEPVAQFFDQIWNGKEVNEDNNSNLTFV